jgi:hypothetical protein
MSRAVWTVIQVCSVSWQCVKCFCVLNADSTTPNCIFRDRSSSAVRFVRPGQQNQSLVSLVIPETDSLDGSQSGRWLKSLWSSNVFRFLESWTSSSSVWMTARWKWSGELLSNQMLPLIPVLSDLGKDLGGFMMKLENVFWQCVPILHSHFVDSTHSHHGMIMKIDVPLWGIAILIGQQFWHKTNSNIDSDIDIHFGTEFGSAVIDHKREIENESIETNEGLGDSTSGMSYGTYLDVPLYGMSSQHRDSRSALPNWVCHVIKYSLDSWSHLDRPIWSTMPVEWPGRCKRNWIRFIERLKHSMVRGSRFVPSRSESIRLRFVWVLRAPQRDGWTLTSNGWGRTGRNMRRSLRLVDS